MPAPCRRPCWKRLQAACAACSSRPPAGIKSAAQLPPSAAIASCHQTLLPCHAIALLGHDLDMLPCWRSTCCRVPGFWTNITRTAQLVRGLEKVPPELELTVFYFDKVGWFSHVWGVAMGWGWVCGSGGGGGGLRWCRGAAGSKPGAHPARPHPISTHRSPLQIHPDGLTGHRVLAELAYHLLLKTLNEGPLDGEERLALEAPLVDPMLPGVGRQGATTKLRAPLLLPLSTLDPLPTPRQHPPLSSSQAPAVLPLLCRPCLQREYPNALSPPPPPP
jgi:hypothetical protein